MVTKSKRRKKTDHMLQSPDAVAKLAQFVTKKLAKENEVSSAEMVLNIIGTGLLSLTELYPSNRTRWASPYIADPEARTFSKRFNIPYLKRTIKRLEKQKLVKVQKKNDFEIVTITTPGKTRILKASLSHIAIDKPKYWDGTWWMVSYDLLGPLSNYRHLIRKFFLSWGFYPLHKSVYLHAYPCEKEVEMLREYFGLGEYLRIFKITQIENAAPFKEFFGV